MSAPSEMVLTVLPSRPRGELFEDQMCNGIWAALMKVDVALQWEFLLRLRVQLLDPEATGNSDGVRLARMVMSVREAYEVYAAQCEAAADSAGSEDEVAGPDEPVVLSENQFERLRERRRELNWMSARTCKRLVRGDWNAVLRRCRLEEVPGGDVLVAQDGGKMVWPEVRDGLQGYAAAREADGADQPWEFSFHDYLAWARLPDTRAMPGRRPMSQSPFDRFGGFTACRHAAMRGDTPPNAADRSIKTRSSRVRPTSGYGIERPQMRKSIKAVKKSLRRVPRPADYIRERDRLHFEAELQGKPLPLLVSYNRIVEEYGGWDAALIDCGYQPFRSVEVDANGRLKDRHKNEPRNVIPTEDVLAGIAEAYEEKGKPFELSAYKAYYAEQSGVAKTGRRLATYSCIYNRFRGAEEGPWKHACNLALPAGWNQR